MILKNMKLKTKSLLIPVILAILLALSSSVYSQTLEALKQKYDKQEVYITMRDGIKLFTSIYTPRNNSTTHPILLNRTPYDIEPGGKDSYNFFMQLYSRYTDDDYIMVYPVSYTHLRANETDSYLVCRLLLEKK